MLSETDIHYLTGFLYLSTRSDKITVVLGEKVRDEASETERDVDIVVATSAGHGLLGVEVKDEARPLHVGLVEALCQKFDDMPTIVERWIVSSSGFSEPAVRKASAHGVRCLRLVQGQIPRFETIDISAVRDLTTSYLEWRDGPAAILIPDVDLSNSQRADWRDDAPVRFVHATDASPRTVRELGDRIVANATAAWPGPDQVTGLVEVKLDVEVTDHPVVELPSGPVTISRAIIVGVVEWVTSVIPAEAMCYLETVEGTALAGVVIMSVRSGLLGLSVSPLNHGLRSFHIPHAVRNIRPIRKTIG